MGATLPEGLRRAPDGIVGRPLEAAELPAKILDEGIAIRGSDIDVVWVNGYGWPVYRGGPMHWADSVGLTEIVEKVKVAAETFALSLSRLMLRSSVHSGQRNGLPGLDVGVFEGQQADEGWVVDTPFARTLDLLERAVAEAQEAIRALPQEPLPLEERVRLAPPGADPPRSAGNSRGHVRLHGTRLPQRRYAAWRARRGAAGAETLP